MDTLDGSPVLCSKHKLSDSLDLIENSMESMSYGNGIDEMEDIDEYYFMDNGLGDDWDPSAKLEPLVPLKYTSFTPSTSIVDVLEAREYSQCTASESESVTLSEDVLELFFTSFIDQELEGEVNVCSWISSLSELCPHLTEKDLYSMFIFIDRERTGYVDVVDFHHFCSNDPSDHDPSDHDRIGLLRLDLLAAIRNHPFFQKFGHHLGA
jgi:hypothetical protein